MANPQTWRLMKHYLGNLGASHGMSRGSKPATLTPKPKDAVAGGKP